MHLKNPGRNTIYDVTKVRFCCMLGTMFVPGRLPLLDNNIKLPRRTAGTIGAVGGTKYVERPRPHNDNRYTVAWPTIPMRDLLQSSMPPLRGQKNEHRVAERCTR